MMIEPQRITCNGRPFGKSTLIPCRDMRQRFRANHKIASCPALSEDRQFGAPGETVTFRVGAAKLIGTTSCKGCVVPTRDPSCGSELAVSQRTCVQQRHTSMPVWANGEHYCGPCAV